MLIRFLIIPILLLLSLCLNGCGAGAKVQLEAVAKDWSRTIRASQVIPVYPLTEDLQPGDIFVVTMSIHDQAEQYEKDGFLPLDMHLSRLDSLDYSDFYGQNYGLNAESTIPTVWRSSQNGKSGWDNAPNAFFPSYSFEANRKSGISVALPISSIPLGLNFLSSNKATGSVSITDAHSYGISLELLSQRLEKWSGRYDIQKRLSDIKNSNEDPVYLRVISRVYLAGEVTVALSAISDQKGGAQFNRDENDKNDSTSTSVADYAGTLDVLNASLDRALPGAEISIAQYSKRDITLNEKFKRPLVIGYLGIDYEILTGGILGPPIVTRQLIGGRPSPGLILGETSWFQKMNNMILTIVNNTGDDATRIEFYDRLTTETGGILKNKYRKYMNAPGAKPGLAFSRAYGQAVASDNISIPELEIEIYNRAMVLMEELGYVQ